MMLQTVTFCWFLVAVASAPSSSKSNENFELNIVEQGTHFTEKIEVDVERNVEQIEVPPHNDIMGSKYIHDFNRNLTLRLTTGSEHCFLSDLSRDIQDGYAVQPGELLGALRHAQDQPTENGVKIVANQWTIGDRVREEDVSLGAEMRRLCLGRDIYWLQHMDDSVSVGSHPHNGSGLIRHRRHDMFTRQCTGSNVKARCKIKVKTGTYIYYFNCNYSAHNHRRPWVCLYDDTRHIFDTILCCEDCCADANEADEWLPFCDDITDVTCLVD